MSQQQVKPLKRPDVITFLRDCIGQDSLLLNGQIEQLKAKHSHLQGRGLEASKLFFSNILGDALVEWLSPAKEEEEAQPAPE